MHATLAAERAYGDSKQTHPNLVLLAVENEQELETVFNDLKDKGVPCCSWSEEDMGDQLTAVATGPLSKEQRKHLRKFPLLK